MSKRIISFLLVATTGVFFCAFQSPSFATDASQTQSRAAASDRVIAVFDKDVSRSRAEDTAEKVTGGDAETIAGNMVVSDVKNSADTGDVIEKLEEKKGVRYVQPDYAYTMDSTAEASDDPLITSQWNLPKIDTFKAWDLIERIRLSRGDMPRVKVAILDTGVDTEQEDLQAVLDKEHCVSVVGSDESGEYPLLMDSTEQDNGGHGTKVAGVMGAESGNGKGMAGVATGRSNDIMDLMVINVYTDFSRKVAYTSDLIKGINYAQQNGARIVNMSLGHLYGEVDDLSSDDQALEATINDKVSNDGMTFFCSAGNDNSTEGWYPSDFDNCISVINTMNYKNAYAKCKAGSSNYGPEKDISAPGQYVQYTVNSGTSSYGTGSGTSFASPTAAAVAAMMLYVNPDLSPDGVKKILQDTATDLYKAGYDQYTAYGNVNALSAVAAAAGIKVDNKPAPLSHRYYLRPQAAGWRTIKLSWRRIAYANGYIIYRSQKKSSGYRRVHTVTDGSVLKWYDKERTFNKRYYYKIKAYGTTDNKKNTGALGRAMAARALPVVYDLRAYPVPGRKIKLRWRKAAGASGYIICRAAKRNGRYIPLCRTKHTYYRDKNIKTGRRYYYKVRAYRTVRGNRIPGPWNAVSGIFKM
ncbi:MAG: S8 family serine peptidase [Anaerovoracaceae bacterium]